MESPESRREIIKEQNLELAKLMLHESFEWCPKATDEDKIRAAHAYNSMRIQTRKSTPKFGCLVADYDRMIELDSENYRWIEYCNRYVASDDYGVKVSKNPYNESLPLMYDIDFFIKDISLISEKIVNSDPKFMQIHCTKEKENKINIVMQNKKLDISLIPDMPKSLVVLLRIFASGFEPSSDNVMTSEEIEEILGFLLGKISKHKFKETCSNNCGCNFFYKAVRAFDISELELPGEHFLPIEMIDFIIKGVEDTSSLVMSSINSDIFSISRSVPFFIEKLCENNLSTKWNSYAKFKENFLNFINEDFFFVSQSLVLWNWAFPFNCMTNKLVFNYIGNFYDRKLKRNGEVGFIIENFAIECFKHILGKEAIVDYDKIIKGYRHIIAQNNTVKGQIDIFLFSSKEDKYFWLEIKAENKNSTQRKKCEEIIDSIKNYEIYLEKDTEKIKTNIDFGKEIIYKEIVLSDLWQELYEIDTQYFSQMQY